jgi:hypothetical protein
VSSTFAYEFADELPNPRDGGHKNVVNTQPHTLDEAGLARRRIERSRTIVHA